MRLHAPGIQSDLGFIQSGCRVMLVYDLYAPHKVHFPTPEVARNTLKLFGKTLRDFNKSPESSGEIPGVFASFLQNTTELQFPILDNLDHRDIDMVEALADICAKNGILYYLADVELKVNRKGLKDLNFDFTSGDVNILVPGSVRLNKVFDFDGTQMARLLHMKQRNLLNYPPTAFLDWVPEDTVGFEEEKTCHGVVSDVSY